MRNSKFIFALATMSGTIIGVGLFSLPYIASKVGFFTVFIYFIVLGAVMISVNMMYGEVALRTQGQHRLPGYAEKYLGPKTKKMAFVTAALGLYGALLAYIIVGGRFLNTFFTPIFGEHEMICALIFFVAGAALMFFGIKSIAQIELIGLILFVIVLVVISLKGFSSIQVGNLFNFEAKHLFLPYGAILFSISGLAMIPEMKEMLKGQPRSLKKLIPLAIIIPIVAYLCFIVLITGITGVNTSEEAIDGLNQFFGGRLVAFLLVFGMLTTFTSFITLGLELKKVFWYDFKVSKNISWALACSVPLVLYFAGFRNFIDVIGFTGGVMLAIDMILIIFIFLKAKEKGDKVPAYSMNVPKTIPYLLVGLFILGVVYQIYYFIQ